MKVEHKKKRKKEKKTPTKNLGMGHFSLAQKSVNY